MFLVLVVQKQVECVAEFAPYLDVINVVGVCSYIDVFWSFCTCSPWARHKLCKCWCRYWRLFSSSPWTRYRCCNLRFRYWRLLVMPLFFSLATKLILLSILSNFKVEFLGKSWDEYMQFGSFRSFRNDDLYFDNGLVLILASMKLCFRLSILNASYSKSWNW